MKTNSTLRVCFISLGCDKNRTDTEKICKYLLNYHDISLVSDYRDSDIAIVNTCAFIRDAKLESINTIKELVKAKKTSSLKKILVIGCLTKDINVNIKEYLDEDDLILSLDKYLIDLNNLNDRVCNILSFSSQVKISDGCNKRCSYCIIPNLRGNLKSNTIENIYDEVNNLVNNGTRELSIVAQDTLSYGIDLYGDTLNGKKPIVTLIEKLSTIKDLKWIRLMYCYPESIDSDIINLIKTNKKVLHYIDMPIQHANNDILRKMNRPTTKESVISKIKYLREEIPDIIIRTTLMVGFPGESEFAYNELLNFVRYIKFDKMGAFSYSREKGTSSFDMSYQIDPDTKKYRLETLMKLQESIIKEKKKCFLGKIYTCIVEGYDNNNESYVVRSYMDARDIDDLIYIKSKNKNLLLSGDFIKVKIVDIKDMDLIGELK